MIPTHLWFLIFLLSCSGSSFSLPISMIFFTLYFLSNGFVFGLAHFIASVTKENLNAPSPNFEDCVIIIIIIIVTFIMRKFHKMFKCA